MVRIRRHALAGVWIVACGCSSSPSGVVAPSDGGAGNSGTDSSRPPSGSGGEGATPGSPCAQRTTPDCQPTSIGPTGTQGTGLAILGRDVYWRQARNYFVVLRTSLDTGATTEIQGPYGTTKSPFELANELVSDGSDVFCIANDCCAGNANSMYAYRVSRGSWDVASDLQVPQSITDYLYADGSVLINFGEKTVVAYSTLDLAKRNVWSSLDYGIALVGADGKDVFLEVYALSDLKRRIAAVDGSSLKFLTDAPEAAYGTVRLLADSQNIYFAAGSKIMSTDRTVPGQPTTLVDAQPNHPMHLLGDARSVYWVDEVGLHAVTKVGSQKSDLAAFDNSGSAGSEAVRNIDQSEDYVVWTGPAGLTKIRK